MGGVLGAYRRTWVFGGCGWLEAIGDAWIGCWAVGFFRFGGQLLSTDFLRAANLAFHEVPGKEKILVHIGAPRSLL